MDVSQWLKGQKHLARRQLSLAVGLGTLGGFLLILQAGLLARIVNGAIFDKASLVELMPWLWPMLAIFLLRALLAWGAEHTAFRAAASIKQQLRDRLYRHLQALGPAYIARQSSGELSNTLSEGIEALEAYYARFLPAVSLMVLIPLSILILVFPLDWLSGVIMLTTAPLIPLFMILIGRGAEKLNQRQWQKLARLSAHFLDMIQGLTTLKLFNASRREAVVISQISDDYRRSTMSVLRVAFLSSLSLEFFATVSIAVVAVLIGFRLLWGDMDFFNGFYVLLLAPEFYLPLRNLGTHYHARMEAIGAAERIVEIMQTPLPENVSNKQSLPADVRQLHIRFQDVQFAYEPGRDALRGVSFEIRPGERIALVGPSGAGKTTIINLLLGFIQAEQGNIIVNGHHLSQLDMDDWRSRLAWVPQRPHLFHGTLLDNIRLGQTHTDEQAVWQAVRRARADEFIEHLPDGLHTQVGEKGQGLSGGQIQRIALARAFLKDAPLVLMDEPTANLDVESERLIEAALEDLADSRSLLTVAHRLHTVRSADRIIVLQHGHVVEQGDHQQLATQDGLYQRMLSAYEGMA